MFAKGHVPGAINLPHVKFFASGTGRWSMETIFVTDCAGSYCNGAARGALRLAELDRPVNIIAGGIAGWLDEGFSLQPEA